MGDLSEVRLCSHCKYSNNDKCKKLWLPKPAARRQCLGKLWEDWAYGQQSETDLNQKLADLHDPDFTNGLPSAVYVDFLQETGCEGPAWEWAVKTAARVATLERMDREAATHVETPICMRTGFTGDPPYVGWKGLGLALEEALDKRDALAARVAELEAERGVLREVVVLVSEGVLWSNIPPPTCPALDGLTEKAPALADDIEQVRDANSQLRYGYFTAHECMKDWTTRARAALGEEG